MDQSPLVNERINAGAKFLTELDKLAPIKVAFWLKKAEARQWYLYVAVEHVIRHNRSGSYGTLIEAGRQIRDPNFDVFEVKLVGVDEPLTREVLGIIGPSADAVPVRLYDRIIADVSAAEIYIYPMPLAVAN